ncbi:MAG: SH3 domain-containing protein [Anaerolineae bacterium]|nr:SH3 domain-containing protein [Anaerolineae bacterium]
MEKIARPGHYYKFRHALWLIVLLLAACNLNNTSDAIPNVFDGPPTVQIAAPLPNATFLDGVTVNIQARVSNAGTGVNRVDVAVDDAVIAEISDPNTAGVPAFSITQSWPAAGTGSHTISVTAYRVDGTASDPASVTINVVGQAGSSTSESTEEPDSSSGPPPAVGNEPDSGDNNAAVPIPSLAPTDEPEPTTAPEPSLTPTPSVPMATFTTGVNVRRGPGTVFEPPIGSFAANDTSEILAISPDQSWYKVKYYNGEGWVFANLMSIAGDTSNLPVDAGPPTPIPVTNTPIPPTAVPATATPALSINLVAGNVRTDPDPPRCKRTFNVSFDVLNAGTDRWPGGGTIRVVDSASGNSTSTSGAIPPIEPGQTVSVGPIPLTVEFNFEEEHTLTLTIDPDNQVPETNDGDNQGQKKYTLRKGDC